jgi:hypothetical protein
VPSKGGKVCVWGATDAVVGAGIDGVDVGTDICIGAVGAVVVSAGAVICAVVAAICAVVAAIGAVVAATGAVATVGATIGTAPGPDADVDAGVGTEDTTSLAATSLADCAVHWSQQAR